MTGAPDLGVPLLALLVFTGVVGACLGSFLNVVIGRVPEGESIVWPGSRCPRCKAPIVWYDNLPVVSYLLLGARCRSCKASISARYLLVELVGAGAAVAALERHGLTLAAPAELIFVLLLVALALIDLGTWLLPHALTWPLIAFGLCASFLMATPAGGILSSATGALVGFGAFALLSFVAGRIARREALGFGDVWLLAAIGAFLGVKALLPVVLLGSLQGAVVGILLILLGRAQKGPERGGEPTADGWVPPRNAVPFGPFLVLGALEWLFGAGFLTSAFSALVAFR